MKTGTRIAMAVIVLAAAAAVAVVKARQDAPADSPEAASPFGGQLDQPGAGAGTVRLLPFRLAAAAGGGAR